MHRIVLPLALVIASAGICFSQPAAGVAGQAIGLNDLAKSAISDDPATARSAIAALRDHGPDGLQTLLSFHAALIARHREAGRALAVTTVNTADPTWERLKTALDEVSGQRDCHASRLFWYTDLEQAKAAAQREHKPILSLRLLGKLTDEYSCANSRFFRTTLYANDAVSQVLRDRFILHWKSVRPVPKVTIDFGDGRKLERTLTGNSIHYVLDSDGRVIDAFPGLYGPTPFLREIGRAETIAQQSAALPPAERESALIAYHRDRAAAIQAAWQEDLGQLGIQLADSGPVQQATVQRISSEAPTMEEVTSDATWNRIATLHPNDGALDAASLAFIASQHPTADAAGRFAMSKRIVETPLLRMVRKFQGTVALDTVRNEYLFHRQIHQWLAAGPSPNLDALNERIYAELFLTPSSDPWLGLMPADTYTALENNGVVK